MIQAPLPDSEVERVAALRRYEILDTPPEEAFDDLTRVAARICGTPIALITLLDEHRQWFKSRVGLDVSETPRSVAFCSHAILQPDELMVVDDANEDPRFAGNPLVVGDPHVIFYAGAPLVTPAGLPLGTLCVIDHVPRELSAEDLDTLQSLARATVSQLELRKAALDLRNLSGDLQRANEDLANRNDEIRRFYQNLSHELKTPLTVAREYVSMVVDGLAGEIGEEQREFLTVGVESCDRIARDLDDLLDLTRIETGKLRLEAGPTSVKQLIDMTATSMTPMADQAGLRLRCTSEAGLPEVIADDGRIMQVISNLVRNALKFTPEGGDVVVEAKSALKPPNFVEVSVRDTGCGIAQEDLGRVFERLYQCKDDDASSRRGLGLGLYLCREIVELHGGWISVESEKGVGTTFSFLLPAHVAEVPQAGTRHLEGAAR